MYLCAICKARAIKNRTYKQGKCKDDPIRKPRQDQSPETKDGRRILVPENAKEYTDKGCWKAIDFAGAMDID
jgi:hypothetical protein